MKPDLPLTACFYSRPVGQDDVQTIWNQQTVCLLRSVAQTEEGFNESDFKGLTTKQKEQKKRLVYAWQRTTNLL